ncbi:MAG: UPF0179 family protein [Methanobacteriota archaeon]
MERGADDAGGVTVTVTLVGAAWAKEGATFAAEGAVAECEGCRLFKVCQNLETGHRYRVTKVREVEHPCPGDLHEAGMRVVEVEELPLLVSLPEIQTRGTGYTHHPVDCGVGCPYRRHCFPSAVAAGTSLRIVKVGEPLFCKVGRRLRLAEMAEL